MKTVQDRPFNVVYLIKMLSRFDEFFFLVFSGVLRQRNIPYTIVLPDVRQNAVFNEYTKRVIERSGIEWWNRVLESDIEDLKSRISIMIDNEGIYKEKGVTLKLIDYVDNREYIEDVVDLRNIYL